MSLKDSLNGFLSQVRGSFGRNAGQNSEGGPISNLDSGGFSGYRPGKAKSGDLFTPQSMQRAQHAPQSEAAPAQDTGYFDYNNTTWQPNNGDPLAQYTGRFGGFSNSQQQPQQSAQQQGWAPEQQQPQQPWPEMQQPWPGQQNTAMPQAQDNISYMPNVFVGDDGNAYVHVERVAQVLSTQACFRVMEFMRNGESVIINTESIGNEPEVQRCLDILSGAAFTLGCSMTRLTQGGRAWLIAPSTVLVMQDSAVSLWSGGTQPEQQQQSAWSPNPAPQQTAYGNTYQPQAEQQSYSQHTAYQQTAYQNPAYQQTAYQPTMQETTWQQPASGNTYTSDTRKGVYATPRSGAF